MSTRCNLMIVANGHTMWLYRHSDGYLSCTGADVLTKVKETVTMWEAGWEPEVALANKFLQDLYEPQSYEKKPRHVYELTNDQHGDVEFVYRMTVNQTGERKVKVEYKARSSWQGQKQWTGWLPLTVDGVNQEIAAMNKRAEAYYTQLGKPFEPQPLLNPDGSPIVFPAVVAE